MCSVARKLCAFVMLVGIAGAAHAQTAAQAVPPAMAAGVVRSYFDAFRKQDTGALEHVTAGNAATKTRSMLSTIQQEARKRDVGVELKVKDLTIEQATPGPSGTAVRARFDIAVVAKKWLFSKVARVITGSATFYVDGSLARGDASNPKIVGLDMRLD